MDAFRVAFSYQRPSERKEWKAILAEGDAAGVSTIKCRLEGPPTWHQTYHVAIYIDDWPSAYGKAIEAALSATLGPRETWDEYHVRVCDVAYLGGCAVETPSPADAGGEDGRADR